MSRYLETLFLCSLKTHGLLKLTFIIKKKISANFKFVLSFKYYENRTKYMNKMCLFFNFTLTVQISQKSICKYLISKKNAQLPLKMAAITIQGKFRGGTVSKFKIVCHKRCLC